MIAREKAGWMMTELVKQFTDGLDMTQCDLLGWDHVQVGDKHKVKVTFDMAFEEPKKGES